ncbi:response regulator transcription factor [Mesorhizobium xinjiangense]|uniref:response regulator transcription factor n=1 Tax=Mesorhizobium xinjiangense TaxID=2678685 RepID=UPI0012EE8CC5|nr:response regulator [Mesorhizobium xinjiangense]
MAADTPTVYLVDDDAGVLIALSRLLGSVGYCVQPCISAEEFLECHDPDVPGCAVLDLHLPGMDGFGLQDNLAGATSDRPIIFLTGHGDIPASVKAIKAGAIDFLTKPVEAPALLAAISAALVRDLQVRSDANQRQSVECRLASLTAREREVLSHVVAGRLNKQIAAELGIAEKTIKVHRGRMMEKMDVQTVAELVRLVTLYETH